MPIVVLWSSDHTKSVIFVDSFSCQIAIHKMHRKESWHQNSWKPIRLQSQSNYFLTKSCFFRKVVYPKCFHHEEQQQMFVKPFTPFCATKRLKLRWCAHPLGGLTPAKDPIFKAIGLTCIKDLGEWKYYRHFFENDLFREHVFREN